MTNTLLPYTEDYVLISKRALLVNALSMSALCQILSKKTGDSEQDIVATIGVLTNKAVEDMTDEQVNDCVATMMAKSWRNQGLLTEVELDTAEEDDKA
ncbi:hypothetical protein [Cylindrospermum sp. FACHB-282]|uniref:hypothetical protein n=1 Tax=Cylindrospermum sp. FACHB-282 TaxID=2692794 RepID=UPI001687B3C0|nr:hypothetical protein [Cylindrospermum sp. FACHB-282]MBD2388820.1 hypothetical protein [Cylindrospermum sp. FACHB-282]